MTKAFYPESTVRVLKELVHRVPAAEIPFLGGSIIEGYGNSTSDIDLLIVADADLSSLVVDLSSDERLVAVEDSAVVVSWADGTRVDVEIRNVNDTLSRIEQINTDVLDLHLRPEFAQGWLEFFNDLRIGTPLNENDTAFAELRRSVNWDAFSRLLFRKFEFSANSSIDDVAGALDARDYGAAELSSRLALEYSIDAWLAHRGQTNPKPKWRFSKLNRAGGDASEVVAKYWTLLVSAEGNLQSSALERAEKRVLFAQDLLLADISVGS